MLRYELSDGIKPVDLNGEVLTTPEGGRIVVDETVLLIWQMAAGRSLEEIVNHFSRTNPDLEPGLICAVLGCLAESRLIRRVPGGTGVNHVSGNSTTPKNSLFPGKLVSAVILGFNDRDWLYECISSLQAQTYSPIEIIVADNASVDLLEPWVKKHFPLVNVLTFKTQLSFAAANNRAVEIARGDYILLLNQDTRLEANAVAEMVRVIESWQDCVCVVPKLYFSWAPAFLNGIGNRVELNNFGTDNAIGHLDLGQFDEWREVPSACFAAALITREGWQTIGPMDENFPFYYEDVEWSYRARLFGYKIGFAPNSIVYHGFGGGAPGDEAGVISPRKLFHIVYGRYRFTLKLLSRYRMTSLWNYIFFDSTRFLKALFQGKLPVVEVYFRAWMKIMREIFSIRKQHREILKRRVMDDECLFKIQADYPKASLRKGLPDLSLNRIRLHYLPLIEAKKTRGILEMEYAADVDRVSPPHSGL